MTKKLNITSITNELEGSAFFPSKKTPLVSLTRQPVGDEPKPPEVIIPTIEPKQLIPERANAPTDQRPTLEIRLRFMRIKWVPSERSPIRKKWRGSWAV
jgi:hypothetical protein